jgi:hypothetical protein
MNLRAIRRLRRQLASDVATTAEIVRSRHPYRAPSVCQTEIDPRLLRGFCRLTSAVFVEMSPRQVLLGGQLFAVRMSTKNEADVVSAAEKNRQQPWGRIQPTPELIRSAGAPTSRQSSATASADSAAKTPNV